MSGPLVVKAGGTTIEDPKTAPALFAALVELSRRPGGVVFVHGGGKAVDRQLERLRMSSERREGIRITPADQVEEITAVLAGRINKALVGALNGMGARAVGLCLGDGDAIPTRKATRYTFDPGRVGEVVEPRAADAGAGKEEEPPPGPLLKGGGEDRSGARGTNLLSYLIAGGFLPVVASIGIDAEGGFLNVNGDDAAAGIAKVLHARELVLMTDVPGILDGGKRLVAEVGVGVRDARDVGDVRTIEGMIASGEITGGMIVKARAAGDVAASAGVPVTIMAGNDPAAIASLGRGERVGTRIRA